MKARSLTQPWATLVAIGAKQYETRSSYTPHRGLLAIHASKGFPGWAKDCCRSSHYIGKMLGQLKPVHGWDSSVLSAGPLRGRLWFL